MEGGVFNTLKAILFRPEKAQQPIWPVNMLPERKASCMEKTRGIVPHWCMWLLVSWLQLLCGTRYEVLADFLRCKYLQIMFLFSKQSVLFTKLEPTFQGFMILQTIREDCVNFELRTMYYVVWYCIQYAPQACVITMSLLVLVAFHCARKQYKLLVHIFHKEKKLHVCIQVFVALYGTKSSSAVLCFCVKVSTRHWSWMWIWGGKNIALLGLDNQCVAQLALRENTLASQLIINSIFFKSAFSC